MVHRKKGIIFACILLTGILHSSNSHAFGPSKKQDKAPPRVVILPLGTPVPSSPPACNFLVACGPGTHEDYNLCQCVSNDACNGAVVKCSADTEFNPKLCTCVPKDCPPPPPCAQPQPPCVFAPVYDHNGCIIQCGSYCPGDGGPLPPIRN